jgi:hypothetical protein
MALALAAGVGCRLDTQGGGDGTDDTSAGSSSTSVTSSSSLSGLTVASGTSDATTSTTDPATDDSSGDPTSPATTSETTDSPTASDSDSDDASTTDEDTRGETTTGDVDYGPYVPCDGRCEGTDVCIDAPSADVCAPTCMTVETCDGSPGGSAELVCVFGVCALDCAAGSCPAGMECLETGVGEHCYWPL